MFSWFKKKTVAKKTEPTTDLNEKVRFVACFHPNAKCGYYNKTFGKFSEYTDTGVYDDGKIRATSEEFSRLIEIKIEENWVEVFRTNIFNRGSVVHRTGKWRSIFETLYNQSLESYNNHVKLNHSPID